LSPQNSEEILQLVKNRPNLVYLEDDNLSLRHQDSLSAIEIADVCVCYHSGVKKLCLDRFLS